MKSSSIFIVVSSLALFGCAAQTYQKNNADYRQQFNLGNYTGATKVALEKAVDDTGKIKELLWSLNLGASRFQGGAYKDSVTTFDGSEALMKEDDLSNHTLGVAGSLLINDTIRDYQYTTYDAVMVNTYKALDFIAQQDFQNARIEFNRADDRQRIAVERFKEDIADQEKSIKDYQTKNQAVSFSSTLEAANKIPALSETTKQLNTWASYSPYINPFASYLKSIVLISRKESPSDLSTAIDLLKRVKGMTGNSAVVDSDIAYASSLSDVHKKDNSKNKVSSTRTWVIFENGQSPEFKEFRVDLPIGLVAQKSSVGYVGIALPILNLKEKAYSKIIINGDKSAATETIANFDAIVASEHNKRWKWIVTRAIIASAIKGVEQNFANKALGNNEFMKIATGAIAAGSTSADIRTWISLPKEFQSAAIDTPTTGTIKLTTESGVNFGEVKVPTDRNSIVYVKSQAAGAAVTIKVLPL